MNAYNLRLAAAVIIVIITVIFWAAVIGGAVYLFLLITKALKKYINSKEVREEKKTVKLSLGEALREHRVKNKMTQEFVSETLGVSRQAVSKWENGTSDPSTSNLIALAKLYNISAEELLKSVSTPDEKTKGSTKTEKEGN